MYSRNNTLFPNPKKYQLGVIVLTVQYGPSENNSLPVYQTGNTVLASAHQAAFVALDKSSWLKYKFESAGFTMDTSCIDCQLTTTGLASIRPGFLHCHIFFAYVLKLVYFLKFLLLRK